MSDATQDPPRSAEAVAGSTTDRGPLAPPPAAISPPISSADVVLTEESVSALFGSIHREGRWNPADEIQVRAICGAVKLDFTRAELPPSGIVDLDVRAIAGGVEITVPDGAEVELEATPVLGSIEQTLRNRGVGERLRAAVTGAGAAADTNPAPSERPVFRIYGFAIFGSIKVTGR